MIEIAKQSLEEHLAAVTARSSTPGGGAVAAVAAAEACALISMVANFTKADLGDMLSRSAESQGKLLELADADGAAFDNVMAAYKGQGDLEPALHNAAQVPVDILTICASHLQDLELLENDGNKNLITDVAIAASLFRAAFEACRFNVLINVRGMQEPAEDLLDVLRPIDTYMATCDQINHKIIQQLT